MQAAAGPLLRLACWVAGWLGPPRPRPAAVHLLPCHGSLGRSSAAQLNHWLQDVETDLARIVGFEVEPYSIAHKYDGEPHTPLPLAHIATCMTVGRVQGAGVQ